MLYLNYANCTREKNRTWWYLNGQMLLVCPTYSSWKSLTRVIEYMTEARESLWGEITLAFDSFWGYGGEIVQATDNRGWDDHRWQAVAALRNTLILYVLASSKVVGKKLYEVRAQRRSRTSTTSSDRTVVHYLTHQLENDTAEIHLRVA